MRRFRQLRWVTLLLVLTLGLAACGGDDSDEGTEATTAAATTGPGAPTSVPDGSGKQIEEAVQEFADAGLRVGIEYQPSQSPEGVVLGQARPPGTDLVRGDTVALTVSAGARPFNTPVPNATGKTQAEATRVLEAAGFEVLFVPVPAITTDEVVFHSPAAGPRVPRGSLVAVYGGS
jgi:serine/threonine-protein kinase